MGVSAMDTVMELRFFFVLGITAIAVAALGLVMLAQWSIDRISRNRVSRVREGCPDRSRARLEHELGARSARWRMLL
jgi:hypothetical protein